MKHTRLPLGHDWKRAMPAVKAVIALLLVAGAATAQDSAQAPASSSLPRLILFSQPRGLEAKSEFVDMGFFLSRSLKDLGRFEVILYSPKDRLVEEAVRAGRLQSTEVTAHLSEPTMQKVAEAVGAVYMVRVSAARSREGVRAWADMLVRLGGNRWSTVFNTTRAPFRSRAKRSELLDAIHAHVGAILPQIAAAPAAPPVSVTSSPAPSESEAPASTQKSSTPQRQSQTPTPTTADLLIDRFRQGGDTANLIVTLRHAINDRPRDVRLRRDLISALRSRGWTEAARDEAIRALAVCGDHAEIRRLLGEVYTELGQPAEAIRELAEAVRQEPGVPEHRLALGDAYLAQGNLTEAEAAYVAARDARPEDPRPRLRIARLRGQALRFQDAAEELKAARQSSRGVEESVYADTYAAILRSLDAAAEDVSGRMTAARRDVQADKLTREDAHKRAMEARELAVAMGAFLADVEAPASLKTAQALYEQAVALLAQSCSTFASFLETRDETQDREAMLLRQEAMRQVAEARKALPAPK